MEDRSLEQFQIPHDPDSFHQLHWQPGQYGKGFVEPNRQVHTWSTGDVLDGHPTHADYRQHKDLIRGGGPSFWINPEGEVDAWGASKEALRALLSVDPRLHVPDELTGQWKFTSVDDPNEHVDPAILLPYREYNWNRDNNRYGPEHWDDMVADVRANGFREPAYLEYNHETGHGYLGEGNHRVGIAQQLGIPVPLVVYRTWKTKEDGYPMKPVTAPGEYSMRNEYGHSQFGQYMKPSDIGLPTVQPATPKRVGAWQDMESSGKWAWIEGMEPRYWEDAERGEPSEDWYNDQMRGQGMNTEQINNAWHNGLVGDSWVGYGVKPHYQTLIEMAQEHPQLGHIFHQYDPQKDWSDYSPLTKQMDKAGLKWGLGIHGPEGAMPHILGPTTSPQDVEEVLGKPLESTYGGDNVYNIDRTWNFSKVADTNLKWKPGNTGKGFVAGARLYTWNTSGNRPHHDEMWRHFWRDDPAIPRMSAAFTIGTNGSVIPEFGDPTEYLGYLNQDPRLTPAENSGWTFSRVANDDVMHTMYHVAPTAARESIQKNGLIGHLGYGDEVRTPWDQGHGQPPGNYLWDSYNNAKMYSAILGMKDNPNHMYPGDEGAERFMDYGIYPEIGYPHADIAPPPPEDFDDWDAERQEDYYDHQLDHMIPYDHVNPEHRLLLPPHLRGYDIWKVHAPGLAIAPDPEDLLVEQAYHRERTHPDGTPPVHPKRLEEMNPEDYDDDMTTPRWVTHDHVEPHRLELARHVPVWEINDEFANNVHDDVDEVPSDWTLLHPRHIMPKHIPPEVRKIWGRKLLAGRRHSAKMKGCLSHPSISTASHAATVTT